MPVFDAKRRVGERLIDVHGARHIFKYPNRKRPRLLGPTSPPVSGYIAHYDPSDLATVTRNVNGSITALADKVGSFNSTGITGNVVLSVPPGEFNGLPGMYFESPITQITTGLGMSDITSSYFAVALPWTLTGRNPCIFGPSADGGFELRINNSAGDGKISALSADTAVVGDNDATVVTAGVPFVAGAVMSASDVVVYKNLSGETDSHAVTFTAARTCVLGRAPSVAGDADRFLGWIGEIVVYGTTLNSTDSALTIGYLMSKWGIT